MEEHHLIVSEEEIVNISVNQTSLAKIWSASYLYPTKLRFVCMEITRIMQTSYVQTDAYIPNMLMMTSRKNDEYMKRSYTNSSYQRVDCDQD